MENAGQILVISSFVVIFASWVSSTFKTGLVSYSAWSSLKKDHPKFEVDKDKVSRFIGLIILSLVLNCVYALIITREFAAVAMFSLFNTVFVAYALTYWVLFKEKKAGKN